MIDVGGLRCRAVRLPLGPGPSPEQLLRRVADWPGLLALRGDWVEGTALLASHPVRVLGPREDHVAAFDRQPLVEPDIGPRPAPRLVAGGWFGWLAYDGPSRLAFYDHVVRLIEDVWCFEALWSAERDAELRERLDAWRAISTPADRRADRDAGLDAGPAWSVGELGGPSMPEHLGAVERAVELIRAGELYQVNVCTRLGGAFAGRPAAMFADVSAQLRPARGALVQGDATAVVSLSPELFLQTTGRDVRTAPIKGTLPRDWAGGDGNDRRLRGSAKDAAENVMIVDLMRNDFGRVCASGSVRVPVLLRVEPHPGVWHLVSSVTGRLRPGVGHAQLLAATLPPGSVTGAPKLRAMDAIAALEPCDRGAYTGAIGFVSPCWGAEFSVAIRTFEIRAGRIELGVGGGVTADSVPMLEWRECLHKAVPLVAAAGGSLAPRVHTAGCVAEPSDLAGGLLETVLALDGVAVRLADHLARLDRSCRELYGGGLAGDVAERARTAAAATTGRVVLRIVVVPGADVVVSTSAASPAATFSDVVIRPGMTGLRRHKWADRRRLAEHEAACGPAAPLFVAGDGAVLETSRGNVFLVRPDGGLVTPPLRDDLLPGVTRRALLDLALDEGRPTELRSFTRDDLLRTPAFWTSSVSGAVPIRSVNGMAIPQDGLVAGFAARLLGGDSLVR